MAIVWVLIASVLFGTTGVTQALALPDADPVQVGALRIATGGVLLGLFALPGSIRRRSRPSARTTRLGLVALVGALGAVGYQPAFFIGVRENGVAIGTLLALGSAPVFTGVIGWIALGQRPDRRWLICTALAVVGIGVLSGVLDGGAVAPEPLGVLMSLLAGCTYAVYTLAVKTLLSSGLRPLEAIGAVFGVAGLVGAAELAATGPGFVASVPLPATLWLGGATIAAAYLLFARGLERLPAPTVATITLAEPVVAAVLGVLVLRETFTLATLIGIALLVLALALLAGRRGRPGGPVTTPVAG